MPGPKTSLEQTQYKHLCSMFYLFIAQQSLRAHNVLHATYGWNAEECVVLPLKVLRWQKSPATSKECRVYSLVIQCSAPLSLPQGTPSLSPLHTRAVHPLQPAKLSYSCFHSTNPSVKSPPRAASGHTITHSWVRSWGLLPIPDSKLWKCRPLHLFPPAHRVTVQKTVWQWLKTGQTKKSSRPTMSCFFKNESPLFAHVFMCFVVS